MRHARPVGWAISDKPVDYTSAMVAMTARAKAIREGGARDLIWLLEHPALYTAGTSAKPQDLREPYRLPVFESGRGGQYTYHGPGQRIAYVLMDLKRRDGDVRRFVGDLERWIIRALATFNVRGEIIPGRVGVWVKRPQLASQREDKIAAIGIRVTQWVTMHGISLNVDPDLSHYDGIVPCGITDQGMTSLVDLGLPVSMSDVDLALRGSFEREIADTIQERAPA